MKNEAENFIGIVFNVLDKGYVQLQDMMPHLETGVSCDLAIVNAARTSFMGESKGYDKDMQLLQYLVKNWHDSPVEMVQFKFQIYAPVVVWWQLLRHRTLSANLASGRYTEFSDDQFYIPFHDEWRQQSLSNKQGSDGTIDSEKGFKLTSLLEEHITRSMDLYNNALSCGVAREQARLFLPSWSSYYKGIISINARNLIHFIDLRTDSHAQYEIRQYADSIKKIVENYLPVTMQAWERYRKKK